MPVRGTLLTYWGLYFPAASTTETPANLSNLDADMASIFGKETPPPKHGRVWAGREAGGCSPDTLVQATQAGRWPGLRPRQTGVVTGTPLGRAAA